MNDPEYDFDVRLQRWVQDIKTNLLLLWLAAKDKRTPLLPRLIAASVAVYAFSPIDFIPDFIPVLGYLDDMVIVPLGMLVALRLIPAELKDDLREKALTAPRPSMKVMGFVVVASWVAGGAAAALATWRWYLS